MATLFGYYHVIEGFPNLGTEIAKSAASFVCELKLTKLGCHIPFKCCRGAAVITRM